MRARWLPFLLLLLAVPSFGMPHIRLRGISVGVGYSHFSGPRYGSFYPPYYSPAWAGYGWWDPFWPAWYGPAYGPAFYNTNGVDKGRVRLQGAAPNAEVYIDGAYAGVAKDLRTLWLAPGAYNVEVRAPGGSSVQKRIYVLTGKSLDIRASEAKP